MDNPPGFVIQSIWALGDSTERFGVSGNRRNLQCELTAKGEEIKPFKLIQTILTQVGEVSRRWGWGGGGSRRGASITNKCLCVSNKILREFHFFLKKTKPEVSPLGFCVYPIVFCLHKSSGPVEWTQRTRRGSPTETHPAEGVEIPPVNWTGWGWLKWQTGGLW